MLLKQHFSSDDLRQCTDEDLLLLYHCTADNKFFAELFSRYVDLAYQTCLKYLQDIEASKDRVMDIFYQLLEKCRKNLLRMESFKSWLFVYIRNECVSYLRCRSSKQKHKSHYSEWMLSNDPHEKLRVPGWSDKIAFEPSRQEVRNALGQLPSTQQQCLHHFFYEKKSYRAIAQTLEINIKQVKSHIQNGKRTIKKILLERHKAEYLIIKNPVLLS